MPKTPKIRYHRKGVDPGLAGVKEWIARWYEEPADFLIRDISIKCPRFTSMNDPSKSKAYKAASQRNESPLHSFLKFTAWTYLEAARSSKRKPQYEIEMYFPFPELMRGVRVSGTNFDPSRAQVIEKGRHDVFCEFGYSINVDVYAEGCSVEAGFTQPSNLCMPLLEGLVQKVLWLPYPKSVDPQGFDLMNSNLKSLIAYEIKASPSSNFYCCRRAASGVTIQRAGPARGRAER